MAKIYHSIIIVTCLFFLTSEIHGQQQEENTTVRGNRSRSAKRKKGSSNSRATSTTTTATATTPLPTFINVLEESNNNNQNNLNLGAGLPIEIIGSDSEPDRRKYSRQTDINSSGSGFNGTCGQCDVELCPPQLSLNCANGLVFDNCNCCQVCGKGQGNRCYNASLDLPYTAEAGTCGSGLSCLLRSDLDSSDTKEALCECRDNRMVCGNDNRTYMSECKLREVAHSNPELIVHMWKPCFSPPWIPTQVENVTAAIGEDVSISCEVRGYPNSIIYWEFEPEDSHTPIILPGEDSSLVVVVRGGPEQIMTTSWLQIMKISPKYQGVYRCIAKNTEGMSQSVSFVAVFRERLNNTTPQAEDL